MTRTFTKKYPSKKSSHKQWRRRGANAGSMAYAAYTGVRQLRMLVNAEKKFHDKVYSSTITNAGSIVNLCEIAQGDGNTTRDGVSVLCNSLYIKCNTIMNITANTSILRYMVIKDKQQIADTAPAVLDVLETASVLSPLQKLNVGRFSVLSDKTVSVLENGRQQTGVQKLYIRTPGHHIRWNGTASTDIQKGGLYLLIISDQSAAYPTFQYNARLSYYDN